MLFSDGEPLVASGTVFTDYAQTSSGENEL